MDTLNKIVIVNLVLLVTIQIYFVNTVESVFSNNNNNNNINGHSEDNSLSIENNLSWSCVNNASCINNLAKTVSNNLKNNRAINFGFMQIESLNNNVDDKNRIGIKLPATEQGRSVSSDFLKFLDGHSIKVPVGPMVINVQGSKTYSNYLEIALLRKSQVEGRRRQDKKQMQMYIPAFLAVNAVGWMLLAIATVKVITFKALLVSKVAFIIASIMTVKKMMEHSTEKQVVMPHVMEQHQPEFMMPYSMEYGGSHAFHGGEMGGVSEMAYPMHHSSGGMDMSAIHTMGSMGAESAVNSVIDMHNATQMAALQSSLAAQGKIKRNDVVWNGGASRQPSKYNYIMSKNPFIPSQKS